MEEANRLVPDRGSIKYSSLFIGFEAGFNSKTTFKSLFKKFTGFTPREYREKEEKKYLPVEKGVNFKIL